MGESAKISQCAKEQLPSPRSTNSCQKYIVWDIQRLRWNHTLCILYQADSTRTTGSEGLRILRQSVPICYVQTCSTRSNIIRRQFLQTFNSNIYTVYHIRTGVKIEFGITVLLWFCNGILLCSSTFRSQLHEDRYRLLWPGPCTCIAEIGYIALNLEKIWKNISLACIFTETSIRRANIRVIRSTQGCGWKLLVTSHYKFRILYPRRVWKADTDTCCKKSLDFYMTSCDLDLNRLKGSGKACQGQATCIRFQPCLLGHVLQTWPDVILESPQCDHTPADPVYRAYVDCSSLTCLHYVYNVNACLP